MRSTLLPLLIALPLFSAAQQDSIVFYTNRQGIATNSDSAFLRYVTTKNGTLWHSKVYYHKNDVLQSEGDYADQQSTLPVGSFDNYLEDGTLFNTCTYTSNKLTSKTYYHENGSRKSFIVYDTAGNTIEQTGWDAGGDPIAGYIVEQPAQFKGGWNTYLQKHLKGNVAARSGMDVGRYEITVSFMINTSGQVTGVVADSVGVNCYACLQEAVRVIASAPLWEPAIQNNIPVNYPAKQRVVFDVTGSRKHKGK